MSSAGKVSNLQTFHDQKEFSRIKIMASKIFKGYIDTSFPEGGKRTCSVLIRREFAERIVRFLKGEFADEHKNFRHLVKKKPISTIGFARLTKHYSQ